MRNLLERNERKRGVTADNALHLFGWRSECKESDPFEDHSGFDDLVSFGLFG